jgi:hypothetical protein
MSWIYEITWFGQVCAHNRPMRYFAQHLVDSKEALTQACTVLIFAAASIHTGFIWL